MPDEFVSCIMFSPPYWSLRDYKVDGQIGLEPDFNEYLAKMWLIFDELWRVLRKDGTMWVNMGDTYSNSGGCGWTGLESKNWEQKAKPHRVKSMPDKSLLMLPEHLMLGLLERGWILRNKCIWQKPNPMPCSAKDRFTTTWEYLFFLTKSKKYWFDLDAVRRPHKESSYQRIQNSIKAETMYKDNPGYHKQDRSDHTWLDPAGKNPGDVITTREKEMAEFFEKRGSGGNPGHGIEGSSLGDTHPAGANPGDFMSIPTQSSKLAHYASYPEKLCETPLKAGCPRWICKECGMPRVRVTKPSEEYAKRLGYDWSDKNHREKTTIVRGKDLKSADYITIGWSFCSCLCPACGEADCKCGEKWRPGIVLDPFVGTGVTLIVAKREGLSYLGIDIKQEYCDMSKKRLRDVHCQEEFDYDQR